METLGIMKNRMAQLVGNREALTNRSVSRIDSDYAPVAFSEVETRNVISLALEWLEYQIDASGPRYQIDGHGSDVGAGDG
jgi:hypothetical protein